MKNLVYAHGSINVIPSSLGIYIVFKQHMWITIYNMWCIISSYAGMATALNKAGQTVSTAISFSTVCWRTGHDDTHSWQIHYQGYSSSRFQWASRQPVHMTTYNLLQRWLQAPLSILKYVLSLNRHVVGVYNHPCSQIISVDFKCFQSYKVLSFRIATLAFICGSQKKNINENRPDWTRELQFQYQVIICLT